MATKKKLLQAAAGQAGGGGLNVEEVFSSTLWTGDGSTSRDIVNNIDLSGEGGAVWIKRRDAANDHYLFDTERGALKAAIVNGLNGNASQTASLKSFNSNGFTVGDQSGVNGSGQDIVSWTFRKAPKFFTCLTYTGNGTAGRTISHDLGGEVGCMIIKKTSSTTDANWAVYHRETVTPDPAEFSTLLNSTAAAFRQAQHFNDTEPTSTEFTLGSSTTTNASGETYVAYLFAHNDGDGEFGDGTQDIIKCGSFTATAGTEVDLGFEPQFIITKAASTTSDWYMFDTMRGWGADQGSNDAWLEANDSSAEYNNTNSLGITPTGFTSFNGGGANYIYIAIRRGPMAVPESATDVFAIDNTNASSAPALTSGFPVDLGVMGYTSGGGFYIADRLRGAKELVPSSTAAEASASVYQFDFMDGFLGATGIGSDANYMWRRAPNYFDVVAYTGNGTAGRTVSHNLGVAPEMIWIKARDLSSDDWAVYSGELGNTKHLRINGNDSAFTSTSIWNSTSPSSTDFTLGSNSEVNKNGNTYIAYLFASLDGVSKVGSYTGNGTNQTIDCGFSSGARFVLIKRTDSTGDWYVWDTERGIVAANDPHLSLNSTAAEVTTDDSIDPVSSGFAVNQVSATNINVSSASYIFYAVS